MQDLCSTWTTRSSFFWFWAHTYVTQMPSLHCRSECRELWSVPGLMEWFISLLIVESTSALHRSLLLIADLSVENMVLFLSWMVYYLYWDCKHITQVPSAYCRSECGKLCSIPGLQGAGTAVEMDWSRAGLQLAVIPPVPTLAEAQKLNTCRWP